MSWEHDPKWCRKGIDKLFRQRTRFWLKKGIHITFSAEDHGVMTDVMGRHYPDRMATMHAMENTLRDIESKMIEVIGA